MRNRFLTLILLMSVIGAILLSPGLSVAAEKSEDDPQSTGYELKREYIYVPRLNEKGEPVDRTSVFDPRQGDTLLHADEVGPVVIEKIPGAVNESVEKNSTRFHKLGRGLSNVFFGWVEIPKNVDQSIREHNIPTGCLVGGLQGIVYGVARTGVGVYETVTFWTPRPGNFEPIIEPEFILDSVWGADVPIFTDMGVTINF